MNRKLFVVVGAIALSSCAVTEVSEAGKKVRVINAQQATTCKFIDSFTASNTHTTSSDMESDAKNEALNRVAELGGDALLIKSTNFNRSSSGVGGDFTITSEAYKCGNLDSPAPQKANPTTKKSDVPAAQPATPKLTELPSQSEQQKAALDKQLSGNKGTAKLNAALKQAAPNIKSVLSVIACLTGTTNTPDKYLAEYCAQDSCKLLTTPYASMKKATANKCLDIARIDGWSTPAMNAIRFRVVYKSPDSKESKGIAYTFEKQADGSWLYAK